MNKLLRIFLCSFSMLLSASLFAQKYTVNGCCHTTTDEPLPNLLVEAFSPDTAKIDNRTVTNDEGYFILNMQKGDYLLRFSFLGIETTYKDISVVSDVDMGILKLNENIVSLKEVAVTANSIRRYGNREEIFLTEQDKKAGTNALQVIGNLPQFTMDPMGNKLKTVEQKSVLLLIDGRTGSYEELSALPPDEIQKITFYSQPPARYANLEVGGVVEVLLKKKKEAAYFLYLNTKNSFTTGYGTNVASFSRNDSLNRWAFTYFIDYRNLSDNQTEQKFNYNLPGLEIENNYEGLPGKYKGEYHIGRVNYQRHIQGSYIFSANMEYRKNPGKEDYSQLYTHHSGQALLGKGTNYRKLESDYDGISLDLYYSKNLPEMKTISFNLINTYYYSTSENRLWRTNSMENDKTDYSYTNLFKNKSYSLIGEAYYSSPFRSGNFNVGGRFNMKTLRQRYNMLSHTNLDYYQGYIYAELSNSWGKWNYNLGIGLEDIYYNRDKQQKDYNFIVAKPSVFFGYNLTDRSSFNLNSSIKTSVPSVGLLTDNMVYLDEKFASTGNPGAKPYYRGENRIQYAYNHPKLYLNTSLHSIYSFKPFMPILTYGEELVIKSIGENKNTHSWGGGISGSYRPTGWLTIQPYYNFTRFDYKTLVSNVAYSQHMAGLSIQTYYKKVQATLGGMLPYTTPDGDFYTKYGGYIYGMATWRIKRISIGLDYRYSPKSNLTYTKDNKFNLSDQLIWNNFKNLTSITFTYIFQSGKTQNQQKKNISNADYDSGLFKDNTAQ